MTMTDTLEPIDVGASHMTARRGHGLYKSLFNVTREEVQSYDWDWYKDEHGSSANFDRLSHCSIFTHVKRALIQKGHNVQFEGHATYSKHKAWQGVVTFLPQNPRAFTSSKVLMDYTPTVLITNDYDGRTPFMLKVGAVIHDTGALVFDDRRLGAQKHTKHKLVDRMDEVAKQAVDEATAYLIHQEKRFETYRSVMLGLDETYKVLMGAHDAPDRCKKSAPVEGLKHLRGRPLDGPPWSMWDIMQSYTSALLGRPSFSTYMRYTDGLITFLDRAAGFDREFRFEQS